MVQSKWKTGERRSVLKRNLDVMSWPDKGEWIFCVFLNVRFAHSSACTVHGIVDRITEIAKSWTRVYYSPTNARYECKKELKCLCSKTAIVRLE